MPRNYLGVPNFLIEVSKNNIPGESLVNKFGSNAIVGPTTDPETVASAGGIYGFYPTSAQNMEAVSSDDNDTGEVLSSGEASGGSRITLEDKTGDFVAQGITAGDLVINDNHDV